MKKIFILLVCFVNISIYSQDGVLDSSFSEDGKLFLDTVFNYPNSSTEIIYDILEQPDGKTVYLGKSFSSSGFFEPIYYTVFRLNMDGTLDSTFGNNGFFSYSTYTNNKNLFLTASKLLRLSDGSFLIAGHGNDSTSLSADIIATKISANGILDTTFGTNGIARFAIGGGNNKIVTCLEVYNDKIYIAGNVDQDSFIIGANMDGSFDDNWNSDGKIILDIDGKTNLIQKMQLLNNKIYSYGINYSEGGMPNYNISVSAFNLDGSSASYGINGTTQFYYGNSNATPNISLVIPKENNETIFVISGDFFKINRYGNLENTFGTGGKIKNPFNQSFSQSAISSDGSFLMTNSKIIGQTTNQMAFYTAKVNPDYTKALTFGTNGEVITNVSAPTFKEQFPSRILVTNNGKVVVAGSVTNLPNPNVPTIENQDYVILRYNNTNLSATEIQNEELSLYPNPTKDILSIKTKEQIKKVEIFDISGRIIKTSSNINDKINVSNLNVGNYLINVFTNKKTYRTKFIKE